MPHVDDYEFNKDVEVAGYWIDKYPVSYDDFNIFLTSTNRITTADKFGDSYVFLPFTKKINKCLQIEEKHEQVQWWAIVKDVNPTSPWGKLCDGDSEAGLDLNNHPVTHVSYYDALAYCSWRSSYDSLDDSQEYSGLEYETRLPTEVEWDVAARGGKNGRVYPWGNKELTKDGEYRANYYQGTFPETNTALDGWEGTNPRGAYGAQNAYGVEDMIGNVWEWTDTPWLTSGRYNTVEEYDLLTIEQREEMRIEAPDYVKKGGSYLCHRSYCYRYRSAARSKNTVDTTAGNLGFRCARVKI